MSAKISTYTRSGRPSPPSPLPPVLEGGITAPACPRCSRRYCQQVNSFREVVTFRCPEGHEFTRNSEGKLKLK